MDIQHTKNNDLQAHINIINDKLYVAGGWDLRMLAKTPERDYWADRQVTCGDVWVTEIPY